MTWRRDCKASAAIDRTSEAAVTALLRQAQLYQVVFFTEVNVENSGSRVFTFQPFEGAVRLRTDLARSNLSSPKDGHL